MNQDKPHKAATKTARYRARHKALEDEFNQDMRPHMRDLSDYFLPRRGRFMSTASERNKSRRSNKLVDTTTTFAARTLAAGFMGGASSSSRPWYRLGTEDPDLNKFGRVKNWLHEVTRRMQIVHRRSNLYNVLPTYYLELGTFGMASMFGFEDYKSVIRFYPQTIGEYYIAANERNAIDVNYSKIIMSVGQVVDRYGIDNVSTQVRHDYMHGNVQRNVELVRAIEPNDDRVVESKFAKNKPFRSVTFEDKGDQDQCLRESGFDEFPAFTTRWQTLSTDSYPTQCPGMDTLGDAKALQIQQKRKAEMIDKIVRPPMQGPAKLQNMPVSTLPGGTTFYDTVNGQADGLRPVYEVKPSIGELSTDIQETQQRIKSGFFVDLFLMISQMDGIQPRQTLEIMERKEEKLLMLGPVLGRLDEELFDPMIDRTFSMMERAGLLPPPPPELEGMDLRVDYISIMHQAQQAVGTQSLEQTFGFAGSLAALRPEAIDKLDVDEAIEQYADMKGADPKVIVSAEDVAKVRAGRAQQVAQQQRAEQMASMAQGAKTLSETDTEGKNALTDVVGGQQ